MKKLFLILALLILGSFWTQGAFANTYPGCYKGYGPASPLYNGTNGDKWTTDGWCVDGYGIFTPQTGITTSSTQPNTQGGFAIPVVNFNIGPTGATGAPVAVTTFDSLIPQQTGSIIVDYGGYSISATVDSLKGSGGHYVLPPAQPGMIFTVVSASQSVITVDTMTPGFASTSGIATTEGLTFTTSDIIEWSPTGTAMTAGQSIKSPGNAGDGVTLVCPFKGIWVIKDMLGQVGGIATVDALWTVISTQ